MAGIDESVGNLEQFIGEASSASAYLLQASSRLDNASDAIDRLEQEAQGDIGGTNDSLSEAESALADAHASAMSALEELAQAAEEAASSTLDATQGDLEEAVEETEDAAGTVRDDLDEAYDRLSEDGFREHTTAMEDLGTAADGASDDARAAFGGLADAVASLTARGESLREAVSGGLSETETEVEQEVDGLSDRFDAVKEVWHQQIDETLSAECSSVGDELHGAYASWADAVGDVADELKDGCRGPLDEFGGFLEEQAFQALEEAVGQLLRGGAEQALAEEGLSAGESETASAIAEALAEITPDLRIAVSVVGEIDRLLDELK